MIVIVIVCACVRECVVIEISILNLLLDEKIARIRAQNAAIQKREEVQDCGWMWMYAGVSVSDLLCDTRSLSIPFIGSAC